MARIENVKLRIVTGAEGLSDPVRIKFNNFELTMKPKSGGTAPGETFESEFRLGSVGHSCVLLGPTSGNWTIESLVATFDYGPYQAADVRDFGAQIMAKAAAFDLLAAPPPPAFSV